MSGQYHFHGLSPCWRDSALSRRTHLIGWALDGFGIYVEYDPGGRLVSSAELDACHGRTSTVDWDGKEVRMYHYDATLDFPYLIGCFRGTPITSATGLDLGGGPAAGGGPGGPPPGRAMSLPSGWREADGALERTFELESFPAAIAFVNAVARIAERENHHPAIAISYRNVTLRFWTHTRRRDHRARPRARRALRRARRLGASSS